MATSENRAQHPTHLLDGKGGGRPVALELRDQEPSPGETCWLQLDYTHEEAQRWLVDASGIDPIVLETLLAEDTRPRCFVQGDGLLVTLRGVNLNPGEDPDDMVSIRAWLEPTRIITVSHRRLMAIEDLARSLENGDGPVDCGDFLVCLCQALTRRMAGVLNNFDDGVSELEDEVLIQENYQLRGNISTLRRQAIRLRRYIALQREVMAACKRKSSPSLKTFSEHRSGSCQTRSPATSKTSIRPKIVRPSFRTNSRPSSAHR